MIDAESFGHEAVLRGDHVLVAIPRKLRVQPLTRPARLARANAVGEDDEVRRGIERLAGLKQLAAEVARQEAASAAGRAVEDEHRVLCTTPRASFFGWPSVV